MSGAIKKHGTVRANEGGLVISVWTLAELPDEVRLRVERYGLPIATDLTRTEAEALATALLDALNSHAAGVAS